MLCELLFFYGKNIDENNLLKYLENKPKPLRIITNSIILNEFLQKKGKNSHILEHLTPLKSSIGKSIYNNAKNLLKNYEKIFQNLTYKGIKIFEGFSYPFLRQLVFLEKTRVVLEDKKNTIFIFEGYFEYYNAVIKLSTELGYKNDSCINYIKGSKIESFSSSKAFQSDYKNRFSRVRFMNFVRYSFQESQSAKFRVIIDLVKQLFSFGIKKFFQRISSDDKGNFIIKIQNKITKSIQQTKNENKINYAFFITGSREDLFFRPLKSVLNTFSNEKTPFKIFTSDLSTSLVLAKKKIPFINLFEQVNIISQQIKNTEEGRNIQNHINQIISSNISTLTIKEFSGYFFRQIFRAIAITLLCDHIFKIMKLNAIFVVADGEMFENIAIALAKKYDIPSITMLPGLFNDIPIFADWFHSDKICVPGIRDFESITSLGYDKNRLVLTGSPRFDLLKKFDQQKSKLQLEKKYKIDSSRKLLLIARALWEERDEEWISKLIKFCNEREIEVVIKIHPVYKTKAHQASEKKLKAIKKLCPDLRYVITYDEDLYLLLAAADLVIITESSTVGVEACLSNKPIIVIDFLKNMLDFELRFHEIGAAIYVDNYTDLENTIIDILTKENFQQKLRDGREKVISLYNYKNDGKASHRIFQVITSNKEN